MRELKNKLFTDIFKKNKLEFLFLGILMLVSSGISILGAYVYMIAVNKITDKIFMEVVLFVIVFLLVNIIGFVVTVFLTYYNKRVTNKIDIKLKDRIFKVLLNRDGRKLSETDSSEYTSLLLSDSSKVSELLNSVIFPAVLGVLRAGGMICFLAVVEWKLLLIVAIVQPIMYVVQNKMRAHMKKISEEFRENFVGYIGAIKEYTSNLFEIIVLGFDNFFSDKFNNKLKNQKNSELRLVVIGSVNEGVIGLFRLIPMGILLIIGGYEVSIGVLSVGGLLLYIQYYGSLFSPFQQIYELILNYESYRPSIEKILELLEEEDNENMAVGQVDGGIKIKDISFGYNNENEVLKHVSARFDFGKTYGIYGESGCGKSTLCKLLLGFWHPHKGSINIGNTNIKNIKKSVLRNYITYVSQDSYLLNESIYNNVVMNKQCSKEAFDNIMKKVNLFNTIENLPMKEKSVVGDKGTLLSGGQKKRIALARTLVNKTPVVILDEPTASLDEKNSIDIIKQLIRDFSDCILIIISHQKDVINLCNVKYQMKEKQLVMIENSD